MLSRHFPARQDQCGQDEMAAATNVAIVTGGARRVGGAMIENRARPGQMVGLDDSRHLSWETPDAAEFDD